MNNKYILVVILAVVIVGGTAFFLMQSQESTQYPAGSERQVTAPRTPQTQGAAEIDGAVAAMLSDGALDDSPADTDPSSFAENDQAINGFGQSLDASQF